MSAPRPAATVVVLRDGAPGDGPEVLMVRRTRGASFMADAWVFPGGRVEESDPSPAAAAVRELAEEAGIVLPAESLVRFAHWITPSAEPKRFDAQFYVAAAPDGQTARHDAQETVDVMWARPQAVLDRHAGGELKLPPPTIRALDELSVHATVAAALEWARARPITCVLPKLVPMGETLAIVLPWDPEYDALPGEGISIDRTHPLAQNPSRFVLTEGRWWGKK
jgi:8-oxo-dGTP pyrophosphatase MutT (NUDIX family)